MPRRLTVVSAVVLALAVAATWAWAQDATPTETETETDAPAAPAPHTLSLTGTRPGDPAAGEAKAATCMACHGPDGNSLIPMYPRLAGQSERYIAEQLALIASGHRSGGMTAVMLPFVAGLSAQDMRDIGAWYASRHGEAGQADATAVSDGPNAGIKLYEIGQRLYRGGDPARAMPACLACHGPAGAGNPGPPYPRIGSQHAAYVAQRLQEYRAGSDQPGSADTPLHAVMSEVAQKLTDEEIQGLASYLQGLHPRPAPAPRTTAAR